LKRRAEAAGSIACPRCPVRLGRSGAPCARAGNGDRGEAGPAHRLDHNPQFENRQGPQGPTHLVAPATAAATPSRAASQTCGNFCRERVMQAVRKHTGSRCPSSAERIKQPTSRRRIRRCETLKPDYKTMLSRVAPARRTAARTGFRAQQSAIPLAGHLVTGHNFARLPGDRRCGACWDNIEVIVAKKLC